MKILSICLPTFNGEAHYDIKNAHFFLATDELNRLLISLGANVDVVSFYQPVDKPLMNSKLNMLSPGEVNPNNYDLIIHMFRDPTPPIVLLKLQELGWNNLNVRILNNAFLLSNHTKKSYMKILCNHNLGIRSYELSELPKLKWESSIFDASIDTTHKYIKVNARNNDRMFNDYVISDYIDNNSGQIRSFFRVGYCLGRCCSGWLHMTTADNFILKSGNTRHHVPFMMPTIDSNRVVAAMAELNIDFAHIEGCYKHDELYIFDINTHPNSAGNTLTRISSEIATRILELK